MDKLDINTLKNILNLINERIRIKKEQALILKASLVEDFEIKQEIENKIKNCE
jgi:hypothetical protein